MKDIVKLCYGRLWRDPLVFCGWQQHVPVLSKNEIFMGHSQVYKLIKSIYNHVIKNNQSEQSLLSFLCCRDSHPK